MGPDVCHLGELPVVEGQVWLGHEVVEELDPGACQQGGQREAEGQVWQARAEGGEEGLELPVFCLLPGGDLLGDLGVALSCRRRADLEGFLGGLGGDGEGRLEV